MLKNFTSAPLASRFKALLNRYTNALVEKPYKTKIITAGILTIVGDSICQTVIEKKTFKETYDYQRTMNLFLIGSVISTPLCHLWYMRGAPAICRAVSSNPKLYPFISMAADQTLIATTTLAAFLFLTEYMKDFSVKEGIHNVKRKWGYAITTNWKVWPPIILINFLLIPPHFRVPFINFLGFFWGYTCLIFSIIINKGINCMC